MTDLEQRKVAVLFLCTGNSARSQMAEAILKGLTGDRLDVHSAGLDPARGVHPMTLRVLRERGLNADGLRAKNASEFLGKVLVAHAIVVCDKAQQNCPRIHPFALHNHYWPFEDPAAFAGTQEQQLARFNEVFDLIERRITQWLREWESALTPRRQVAGPPTA